MSDVTRLLDAGASFVRTGETGAWVDGLPPGARCAESDDDVRVMAVFMEAVEHAQALDRHRARDRAANEFDTDRICGSFSRVETWKA